MRQRIRETQPLWTYNYTAEYVTEKVVATATDPATFEYRANDTACEAGNYTTVRRAGAIVFTEPSLRGSRHANTAA